MAVSDISGHRQELTFWKRLLGQLSRYDLLLAAIPLLFTAALLTYLFAPVTLHVAVGGSAVISGILVMDALYFHPPTARSTDTTRQTDTVSSDSIVGHHSQTDD